jgi:phenylalanyl-tRNA synthetase beta chain
VDVIEDILRIYGYNNVEISDKLTSSLSYETPSDESYDLQTLVSEQLTGAGFYEIMNNSLTKEVYYTGSDVYPAENCVRLLNPLSADLNVMRQTLLFGGLESIAFNRNRKNGDLKLYEFGNCYFYEAGRKAENETLKEYAEGLHLGMWLCGDNTANSWAVANEKTSVYLLKGYIEAVLLRLGITEGQYSCEQFSDGIFSAGLTLKTRNRQLGVMGIVNKKWLKMLDINTDVYFAELNWNALLKETRKHAVTFRDIPKYPAVKRDLALLVDKKVTFDSIKQTACKAEKKLLQDISLFDVYEGKNLPENKKSYAVNFVLQDCEKTLEDRRIDAVMKNIRTALETELGAQLR